MAERKAAQQKRIKKSTRKRPAKGVKSPQTADHLIEQPGQANALPARLDAMLQLQRQLGNKVVQRQVAEEKDKNRNLSTKGLGMHLLLEGHPYSLLVQREGEDEAGEEEATKPSVDISIKLNEPQVKRMSEKKVQRER